MTFILKRKGLYLLVFINFLLLGCSEREALAPVSELSWKPFSSRQESYRVQKGDTLYAIAFKYDRDYRRLAAMNHLQAPYSLHVGQKIYFHSRSIVPHKKPKAPQAQQIRRTIARKSVNKSAAKPSYIASTGWRWPAKGQIKTYFAPQTRSKGINIAGKSGDKIYAAQGGTVAYAGNGLRGYGNMIIIKHNQQYLSAYANNLKNLVKEGDKVKAGQMIAYMGKVNRAYWGVHFEIRKLGNPIDPLKYLQKA